MKKKKLSLDKKLTLTKATIADLNTDQQNSIVGGATVGSACITESLAISSCIATRPSSTRPCCQIP
ncbi:class I lanthipeptide [Chitinophaga skermanii]|uniref:class I lanthipeptide n=1 Tax=Chitinophaga skermanii TaxID=331697 RepID=UPI0011E59958|nr:class I lanthipeptide [Chitinophaga skermanii]